MAERAVTVVDRVCSNHGNLRRVSYSFVVSDAGDVRFTGRFEVDRLDANEEIPLEIGPRQIAAARNKARGK
jgi:hypothetical protein